MTTTPNMGLVLPVEGGSSNVWDVILDTVFGAIDAHGHVAGQGVPIVSAALGIDDDVSWAGFAISHLKAAYFTEQSSAPATNDAVFVLSSDHNLYFRNSSGVNVKITDGNTLNVSIVGGIGGDYSSVGALLQYDDATQRYLLQQEGSPRPWAGVATADIDLYEKAASIVNKVTLKSPGALAASYALTFPASIPVGGNDRVVSVSTTSPGQLIFSNTLSDEVIAPDFRNSTAIGFLIPASSALPPSAGGGTATGASGGVNAVTLGTTNKYTWPVRLPVNATITAWSIHFFKHSSNATTLTAKLCTVDMTTGTETVQSTITNNDNATGAATNTASGLSISVSTDTECYVAMSGGADVLDLAYQVQVNYKRA